MNSVSMIGFEIMDGRVICAACKQEAPAEWPREDEKFICRCGKSEMIGPKSRAASMEEKLDEILRLLRAEQEGR